VVVGISTFLKSAFLERDKLSAGRFRRRRGLIRLSAYVGVLLTGGLLLSLRSARAEISTISFELGRDMYPLRDLLKERARVNVNGEHLWASSGLTPAPVAEVLGRFESHCREAGAVGNTWGDVSATQMSSIANNLDSKDPEKAKLHFGVFRSERNNEGAILCFPKGGEGGWLDGFSKFVKSQDLGDLGRVRYVYVRRDREVTHVLTMWTDEHLRLDKLAGSATDIPEPGSDNPDLPRPVRSQRTVSAGIEGTPYGVHGYLSQAKPAEVLEGYSQEMEHRGWKMTGVLEGGVRGYLKDGSLVTIGTEATKEGTVVGIAEMGVDPEVAPMVKQSPVVMD
jgi:hypothetical protein